MASHKELRVLMLICYADNMLSDEELLVLWEILACNNNNNHNNVIPVFPRKYMLKIHSQNIRVHTFCLHTSIWLVG